MVSYVNFVVQSLFLVSFIQKIQGVEQLKFLKWHRYNEGELTTLACDWAISEYMMFCDAGDSDCMCFNQPSMFTYLNCIAETADTDRVKTQGFKYFKKRYCPQLKQKDLDASINNGSKYLDNVIVNDMSTIQYRPVLTNSTIVANAIDTFRIRYKVFDDGMFFGMGLCGYFAFIILCAVIHNILEITRVNNAMRNTSIYKKIMGSSFVEKMSNNNYNITKENIIIVLWCIFNVLSLCFDYHQDGSINVYWDSSYKQIVRYISDRAGYIALFLTNLTWFMGQRNNLLSVFTGWPQAKFLLYHKWIGRACAMHVIVHSIFLLWQSTVMGYQAARVVTYWYQWGCVATICVSIQVVWACWFIKNLAYETFLVAHIILAVFFLVGSWYHLALHEKMAHWLIYPICAWGLERLWRAWRIWFCGGVHKKAIIKLNPLSDVLSVKVESSFSDKFKLPGQFAYLYLINLNLDWVLMFQSHPFTFVYQDDGSVMFYCKVKKGITKKLRNYLLCQPNYTSSITVMVEGPYGGIAERIVSSKQTDHLIMASTGTGISGAIGHLKTAIKNKVPKISLVWIVPYWSDIEFIKREFKFLQQEKTNNIDLRLDFYVTREDSNETIEKKTVFAIDYINIHTGKPDISAFFDDNLASSPLNNYKTNVLLCTHHTLRDIVQKSVAKYRKSGHNIELFDETQQW